jgi:uncharacterized OB-fold protein
MQFYDDIPRRCRVLICDCGTKISIPNSWFIESRLLDVRCNKCGTIYMENGKECYKKGEVMTCQSLIQQKN